MELSIIIVSFNTKDVTSRCLNSLVRDLKKYPLKYEIVVVDNASVDGSLEMLKEMEKNFSEIKVIKSNKNVGYGKANNLGVSESHGKYILYLNSDAIVKDIDFRDLIMVMKRDQTIGAMTVRVVLSTGDIDPASHRGFPTIWRSFAYFSGLEKATKTIPFFNRMFGGYHLTHLDIREIHDIEVPTGAFLLVKRDIVDTIGGFDRDYFAYGEDVEMAFQINKLGYRIVYYPLWEVLHLKSVSGLKKKDDSIKKKTSFHFYDSMKIFYKKHYAEKHNFLINELVYTAINLKQKISA